MFRSLKQYVIRTKLPEVHSISRYMIEEEDVIDSIAEQFYPTKDGPNGYILVETIGDGNCGYQTLAHVLLSDEGWYHEVWVHITFEALLKE